MQAILIMIALAVASVPFVVLALSKPVRRPDRPVETHRRSDSSPAYHQAKEQTLPDEAGHRFLHPQTGADGVTRAPTRLRLVRTSTRPRPLRPISHPRPR